MYAIVDYLKSALAYQLGYMVNLKVESSLAIIIIGLITTRRLAL